MSLTQRGRSNLVNNHGENTIVEEAEFMSISVYSNNERRGLNITQFCIYPVHSTGRNAGDHGSFLNLDPHPFNHPFHLAHKFGRVERRPIRDF